MNTPIPYCEESIPAHGPVRSLFVAGEWQVPVKQRPKDWKDRMGLKPDPTPPAPREWVNMRVESKQATAPKPKATQKPKTPPTNKRIHLTPEQIAQRAAVKGVKVLAEELGANEFTLYRILRDAGVAVYHLCVDCQKPCGGRKRCDECRKKRINVQQLEGRDRRDATIPGHKEKRMEYFKLRGHAKRKKRVVQ